MAVNHGNGPELTNLQIQDLAERLEVSSPIMSYRVVGERVELHLLGGGVAIGSLGVPSAVVLEELSVKELRLIAAAVAQAGLGQIPGAKKLRKSELLAALATIDPKLIEEVTA
jgi:hypothetical protein